MSWFAVRTFVRNTPSGRPNRRDQNFRAAVSSLEERIVLFQARSGKSALKKGRAEAQKYAQSTETTNVYGQQIVASLLPYVEAYELFEAPANGIEVFSAIEIIRASETQRQIINRRVGKTADFKTGRMFISGRITRELETKLRSKVTVRPNAD